MSGGIVKGGGVRLLKVVAFVLPAVVSLLLTLPPADASVATVRPDDPVVLKGSDLSRLNGIAPNLLAAFRWTGSAWDQCRCRLMSARR